MGAKKRTVIGRRKRIDMAEFDTAIRRSPKYRDRDDFMRKTKAMSRNTKTTFLRDKMLRMDCVREIAKELGLTNPMQLVVPEPEEFLKYNPQMEVYRRYASTYAYGIHCDQFETGPDGSLQRQNVWHELELAEGKRYPEISTAEKLQVMERLCRDGFFFKAGDLDYRIKTNDREQLLRIVNFFRGSAELGLESALQFILTCEAAAEFFRGSLALSLEACQTYRSEGLNFRLARRRFFYSFGLELGQVGEGIAGVLDAADQVHLQCRYLLKVRHGGVCDQYRKDICTLNAPLLADLEELNDILQKEVPDRKAAINIVRQHPNNIERLLVKRDQLLAELKDIGALSFYDV